MAVGAAEIQDAAAKNQSPSHRRAVRESGSVEENVNAAWIATAEESVSAAENATAAGNVSRSAIVRAAAIPGLNPASSRDRFPIPDADAMTNSVYG